MRGCVLNLVDVGLGFEVVDADLGDVLFLSVSAQSQCADVAGTHLNTQIGMHQDLELKVLATVVLHLQRRSQSFLAQGDAVHERKLVWPRLAEVLAKQCMRQSKVELDRVIPLFPVLAQGFRRGLAEKLPVRIPGEAVLRQ